MQVFAELIILGGWWIPSWILYQFKRLKYTNLLFENKVSRLIVKLNFFVETGYHHAPHLAAWYQVFSYWWFFFNLLKMYEFSQIRVFD